MERILAGDTFSNSALIRISIEKEEEDRKLGGSVLGGTHGALEGDLGAVVRK